MRVSQPSAADHVLARIEDKRADLAAVPEQIVLTEEDVAEIRAVGDNTGCMALKGGSPDYHDEPVADRWPIDAELEQVAARWSIDPAAALHEQHATA